MTSDDLRRIFFGPTLFRIDTILATKLVPLLYGVGLVSLLVWAINHLFFTFGSNFGNGLWGLVEIAVFGLLWLIALRIACEAVLVFFRTHEGAVESVRATRISATLLEDVREAIHDLAEDEAADSAVTVSEPVPTVPQTAPRPPAPPPAARPGSEITAAELPQRGPVVRRTAKRSSPASAPPTPPEPDDDI
jgi:hypothetical protein